MKVTVNLGMSMPSWYDIADTKLQESLQNLEQDQDVEGILKSRDQIHKLVDLETKDKGIPSSRIVLGGFSQGGALALISGITYPSKLGGIFSLSGYLPIHDKAKELSKIEGPNSSLPIFMAHGTADPTVSHNWGITSKEALKSIGWTVNFRSYDGMGHTAVPEEIDDLEKYLAERLPPLDASVDE
ncbi:MAG: hypothetical protein M1829_000233 [Trizodia sp. TS-e1964]|nr:MAG: hypothetical protein M1829_000233 [Trizodia sp. TS-e1964]